MSKYIDSEGFKDKELNDILDAIASPSRLEILRQLYKHDMNYTELIRAVGMNRQKDAGKFSYHLKRLMSANLIKVDEKTKLYELSPLGKTVLELVDDMKKRLASSDIIIVRRSDCEMEPFDRSRIANTLVKEAGMPTKLAHKIAKIVEEKLVDLKIEYLSAPLIRELVNSILIDEGLESYRHKLTRVGMPLYDVKSAIKDASKRGGALSVIRSAFGSVIKEYSLLDNLPRSVADAYLSGLIDLYSLETWVTSFYSKVISCDSIKGSKGCDLYVSIIERFLADLFSVCGEFILYKLHDKFSSEREISCLLSLLEKLHSLNLLDGIGFVLDLRGTQDKLDIWYDLIHKKQGNIMIVSELDSLQEDSLRNISKRYPKVIYSCIPDRETISSNGFRVSLEDEIDEGYICSIASINLIKIALESDGDIDRFIDNLKRALMLVSSAFMKKAEVLEDMYEKKITHQFIISPCGAFESAGAISSSQDFTTVSETLVRILSELVKYAHRPSRKKFRIKVSNVCPQSSSKRFAKLDINKYGIKSISRLLVAQQSQSIEYTTSILPAKLNLDLEERFKIESRIARMVDGGYVTFLHKDIDPSKMEEVLELIKKYLLQEGISIKFT